VILAVDDEKITTFDELRKKVHAKKPGDHITLTIDRNGEKLVLKAQLTKPDGTLPLDRSTPSKGGK
jgi:S1-C subfamily serine protease